MANHNIKHPLADGTIVILRGDPDGSIYGGKPMMEERAKILGHEVKETSPDGAPPYRTQYIYTVDNLDPGNGRYADSLMEVSGDDIKAVLS